MTETMNGPIISIVVPVYNVERDLDRCVKSLTGQTLREIQIILVDDGSTDSSGSLCDIWASRDARIRVIHKQNGGLSSARNAGIEVAEGDYLGFVDSDDYVEPKMYETLLSAVKSDVSIVTCGRFVHMGGYIKKEFSSSVEVHMTSEEAIKEVLLGKIVDVSACDKLYRRDLFDGIRYPEGRISEDAAVILPLFNRCSNIVHVGSCLYHYVFRNGSISKSCYGHKKYDVMRNCTEMIEWAEDNKPEVAMYVGSYCCVQMAGMIEDMLNTRGARRTWHDDYAEYWSLFRYSYKSYMKLGGHQRNEVVRIVATRMHLYRLFWFARQMRNGVKCNGVKNWGSRQDA